MNIQLVTRGETAVLSIRGRFDFGLHGDFRRCSEEALERGETSRIEVDLTQVDYLDSSALGMLLLLREKADKAGSRKVSLTGSHGLVRQVLEVANFDRLFGIA